jgi:secreted PhoX family phosphatase
VQPDQRSDLVVELDIVALDKKPEGHEKMGRFKREGVELLEPIYLTRSRELDAKPTAA